jgi:hypothetical protein
MDLAMMSRMSSAVHTWLLVVSLMCALMLPVPIQGQLGDPEQAVREWMLEHSSGMPAERGLHSAPKREPLPQPCTDKVSGGDPDIRTLQRQEDQAVIVVSAMQGVESCEQYCFLQRIDAMWTIIAVKTMPYLAELRSARDALDRIEQRTPEQEAELARFRVLTGADAGLRAYAMQNEPILRRIVDLYQSGKRSQALKLARSINIIEIDEGDDEGSARIEFILGGMHDTAVGLLYVPRQEDVPHLTPSGFIYVEEVLPSFSVFRSF